MEKFAWLARFSALLSCVGMTSAWAATPSASPSWEIVVPLTGNTGVISVDNSSRELRFLRMGEHSFAPSEASFEVSGTTPAGISDGNWRAVPGADWVQSRTRETLSHFQSLEVERWKLKWSLFNPSKRYRLKVHKQAGADAFFDQIILVGNDVDLARVSGFVPQESGRFGAALPPELRERDFSAEEQRAMQESLFDPVIHSVSSDSDERRWSQLRGLAFPLDYQKILLASPEDSDPGFAYQNGQWFVTVPSEELSGNSTLVRREDRWFIPSLRIGKRLWVPAPLSAKTGWVRDERGAFLPQFRLSWLLEVPAAEGSPAAKFEITQWISSQLFQGTPFIVSKFKIKSSIADRPVGSSPTLVLATGRRPSVHFWSEQSEGKGPLSFISLAPRISSDGPGTMVDASDIRLLSNKNLNILRSGETEALIESPLSFDRQGESESYFAVPQRIVRRERFSNGLGTEDFTRAQSEFEARWQWLMSKGAQMKLPRSEWQDRIQNWLYQTLSIARIGDRLNYGAYYYTMFFGIEEGWPVLGLAQWGQAEEARRQAEILLSPENLDKRNYHHQYRNGLSAWYAVETARMTGDLNWLRKIAPVLLENSHWTIRARHSDSGDRTLNTLGLLPKHIYGGDIPTPAFSLYSNATCWRGMMETAQAYDWLNESATAAELRQEATRYRDRLAEVFSAVLNRESRPAFLPMALEFEAQPGAGIGNERPYPRLTDSLLGNYWNLFAPLFLHTGLLNSGDARLPSEWLTDYLETHGGLWGGLPRFFQGLDAVYAIGYIHELLERSKNQLGQRNRALAALESFLLHASSQNGFAVPEVSGFFPSRVQRSEYEKAVRSAPWMMGVYNGSQYLQGQVAITEPLGAGAGEGLALMRKALVDETRTPEQVPDGGLFLFPTIPADWLDEGKVIELDQMPTAYGQISIRVESFLESRRQIVLNLRRLQGGFAHAPALQRVRVRLINRWGTLPKYPDLADPSTIEVDFQGEQERRVVVDF